MLVEIVDFKLAASLSMHIPERPSKLQDLDLMLRLRSYAEGTATWHANGGTLGAHERDACRELQVSVAAFIEKCVNPLLDRVTSREMQTFTMHDRGHGLKVAHLMWHIIEPSRRNLLTPGEIGLLVTAAHFHDLGMGLSEPERKARLEPDSDLWDKIDPQSAYSAALGTLTELLTKDDTPKGAKADALFQIQQAQEALLCLDNRERHATPERYNEMIASFRNMHRLSPEKIPDVDAALSFDGDSYRDKLIDVCVSHNQDVQVLLDPDPTNFDQLRFPREYPIGCCVADVRFVAATLRQADILDFDRERTPAVLYFYLLPRSGDPKENVSIREWSKHLAISNWELREGKIIFRGRSPNAVVHHAIIEFCKTIQEEITKTRSVFGNDQWPFILSRSVEADIQATGYRYIPYRFSLDEARIYDLLMGENIYHDRLDAVRELVQNAVDACKLRDAMMVCHDSSVLPSKASRITVRYEDPREERPATLTVIDTGIGMDQYVIENYFLKVGRSYYRSSDFFQTQATLRKKNLDFKPVSEFGIGFMAIFMLGDRVEVETAPWIPTRNDTQRRTLRIDGLGRLIELIESQNSAVSRFYGTRVSVQLASRKNHAPPTWNQVESYLRRVCKNIEFPIHLEHLRASETVATELAPEGLSVPIPHHLKDAAIPIPVNDPINGLTGEMYYSEAWKGVSQKND